MNFGKDLNGDVINRLSPGGIRGFEKGFSPAAGLKRGQVDRRRKLNGVDLQFAGSVLKVAIVGFRIARSN